MEIERNGRQVVIRKICDECDASYSREIDPNTEEWDDILRKAELGLYVIDQDEDEISIRESYFICADCNNSTHMDDTSGEPPRIPEDSKILFPHPFFKISFKEPKPDKK